MKEVDSVEDGYVHVSSGSAEPNTLLPATNGDPQVTAQPDSIKCGRCKSKFKLYHLS